MKSLLYIGNKLSKHGVNQTSIETLGILLENEGYKIFYASSKKNKFLRLLDMVIKTIINCRKVDYVLIDTYSTYNFWYALIISQLCRTLNLKYIPILHGGNLPTRLNKNPVLSKSIFKNSFINVAPSNYLLSSFIETGFSNTVFIPNILDIRNYSFKNRINIEPKLLWVRSFSKIYNPEMAIQVLKELEKGYKKAQLCMVGPDSDGSLNKIKQLALDFELDVKFTGKLSKPDWTNLSVDYDIFINTTHFDNTPLSVIEAMALGLPIVSTNVGGIPFLLEHENTALLVDDNNIDQMVICIKKIIEDNDLKNRLIQNAFDLVQNFDFQKVKYQWFKILN